MMSHRQFYSAYNVVTHNICEQRHIASSVIAVVSCGEFQPHIYLRDLGEKQCKYGKIKTPEYKNLIVSEIRVRGYKN